MDLRVKIRKHSKNKSVDEFISNRLVTVDR